LTASAAKNGGFGPFFTEWDFHMQFPGLAQHLSCLQHLRKVFHFSAALTRKTLWTVVEKSGLIEFSKIKTCFPQVIHNRLWAGKVK